MYVFEALYPIVVAGANIGVGWLVYAAIGSLLGVLPLAIGAIVLLAVLCDVARAANRGSFS